LLRLLREIGLATNIGERSENHFPHIARQFVCRADLPPACLRCTKSGHLYFPLL